MTKDERLMLRNCAIAIDMILDVLSDGGGLADFQAARHEWLSGTDALRQRVTQAWKAEERQQPPADSETADD